VLAGLPAATLAPLQRVLHAAARLVDGLRPCEHVTSTLKELHWLPIAQRIDCKLCLLVHKSVIINRQRTCLPDQPSDCGHRLGLRFATSLTVPLSSQSTRLKLGERAFSVAAPLAWNRLPSVLKTMRPTTAFKRGLKTFLFRTAYNDNLFYSILTRIFQLFNYFAYGNCNASPLYL
jgi:hypothetical protein